MATTTTTTAEGSSSSGGSLADCSAQARALIKTGGEYAFLQTLGEDLHALVRLVTNGLLFVKPANEARSKFFSKEVEPLLEKLSEQLKQVYDASRVLIDVSTLSKELQELEPLFRADIDAALINDPATEDPLEVIFCYPGYKAIRYHRIAHVFHRHSIPLLPRMISELAHEVTGIDIAPGASIGSSFFIDHGTGVVIGDTAIIGDRVTIFQGVTLGAARFHRDSTGRVVKGQPRHPIIGSGVTIYANATILGRITVGDRSVIGGNVWVTESVPPDSKVSQQRFVQAYFRDGEGI